MSGYEQRLAADKKAIRERVSGVGKAVAEAVSDAVRALLDRDDQACARIMLGDLPINREIRDLDRACHAFIARHLPSAGHLRFISSVLQMNVAIERVGDYAVTIAREGVQLSAEPPEEIAGQLRHYLEQASSAFEDSIRAFHDRNEALAREVKLKAQSVGRRYAEIFRTLVVAGGQLSTADAFALYAVSHRLERMADQAKNLCEETLFELTGETKPPKRYRVLFASDQHADVARLAVALAMKAFPESGEYFASGPEGTRSSELVTIAENLSIDLPGAPFVPLADGKVALNLDELSGLHVIVCLGASSRALIERVPYSTILLKWDVGRLPPQQGKDLEAQALKNLSESLRGEIRELMVTMRGEGAS